MSSVSGLENLEIIWPHKLRFQIIFSKTQCFPSWCFFLYMRDAFSFFFFFNCSVELNMEQDLQQWPWHIRALWEEGELNTFPDLPDCFMSSTGCVPSVQGTGTQVIILLCVPGIKPYSAHFLNGVDTCDFPVLKRYRRTGIQAKKCSDLYDPSHREYLLYQE